MLLKCSIFPLEREKFPLIRSCGEDAIFFFKIVRFPTLNNLLQKNIGKSGFSFIIIDFCF